MSQMSPSVGPWTASKFHQNFNAANPLTLNGTTARCSNCHLNVKPTAAYTMPPDPDADRRSGRPQRFFQRHVV